MRLILPFPPTVNTYWRNTNRGVLISASGRCFRSNAYASVLDQLKCAPKPIKENVQVHLVLYPPARQRRDLDNYQKALFDSLTYAGVWQDDSQIKRMVIEWGEVTKNGRSELMITPFRAATV